MRELIGLREPAHRVPGGGRTARSRPRRRARCSPTSRRRPRRRPGRGAARRSGRCGEPDEFSAFLSAVSTTVAQTVEAWRSRIGEAVLRWQGEGYRTRRLEQLLLADEIPDVGARAGAVRARDVEELRRAGERGRGVRSRRRRARPCFRDPDADRGGAGARRAREGGRGAAAAAVARASTSRELRRGRRRTSAAVRAAQAVVRRARDGATTRSFITGPSGTGKTHLLHAVGQRAARRAARRAWSPASRRRRSSTSWSPALDAGPHRVVARALPPRRRAAARRRPAPGGPGRGRRRSCSTCSTPFADAGTAARRSRADRGPGPARGHRAAAHHAVRGRARGRAGAARPADARRDGAPAPGGRAASPPRTTWSQYLAARPADSARAVQGLVNRALPRMDPACEALTVAGRARRGRRPARSARRRRRPISAAVPAGARPGAGSREKVVWDWPDVGDRARSRSCADGDQGQPQGGEPPRRAPAALDGAEDGMPLGRRPQQLRLRLLRPRAASPTPRSSTAATGWATSWSRAA